MEKCDVNGPNTHPVYQYLRTNTSDLQTGKGLTVPESGAQIGWNYAKFLVDSKGKVKAFLKPVDSCLGLSQLI